VVKDNPGLSPSDFNDVKISDFDTHADQLKGQRLQAQADLLGVSVEDLPAALARARGQAPVVDDDGDDDDTPQARTAGLGALGGRPASFDSQGDIARGLEGKDLIAAAFMTEAKNPKR
jgi:hypothetical protein